MSTIVTRSGKGSPLSWLEMDTNLTNLNNDKVETSVLGNAAFKNTGTGAIDVATGDHLHTGVYEPADNTILKDADIGVTVQVYDADTAKTDVAQNFTQPQRSELFTDNDGVFDLSAKQNFKCTTSGTVTLTFSNQVNGLSGSIIFINSSNHIVAAHSNTKLVITDLNKLSTSGTYRIDYITDGINAYCSVVGAY